MPLHDPQTRMTTRAKQQMPNLMHHNASQDRSDLVAFVSRELRSRFVVHGGQKWRDGKAKRVLRDFISGAVGKNTKRDLACGEGLSARMGWVFRRLTNP